MPIGNQQNNNFLRLTLDVWQDKVFHNEKEYPAGYFAAAILNTPMDEIGEMLRAGDVILGRLLEVSIADKKKLGAMLPLLKEQVQTLAELLLKYPPFCFHDKEQERHLIEVMFSPETLNDLARQGSATRNFFLRYLKSIVRIPPAIYHFYAAGRFFELDYLRRLKKHDETFFAIAAHDCFTSELFWEEMHSLQAQEMEPFTITPELNSSYVFARHPKDEKKMVFVNRYFFEHFISFYIFDLMNGLHHGHAPSQCRGCGKYFLTTNGHMPKYCDGIAPQDPRLTCRQYGAKMRQKEQNKQHPVYRLHTTRTGTIRKHYERGKIPYELRQEAIYVADMYRERALMDKDYAASGYERDMELEHIYAEAQKRLK
ncbi:DUF6076 domain-containing protein [uncultured Dysosmobacter sp.]|uniref:DUF6076 domain-containing protein n=1 Tax=uncultured Dysosmobacter sp. TaxID=2591384 RepID=UPI002633B9E2|nr:DUF6076 domain-containing protein [uncultured Dysosmobacter sp.]